MQQEDLLVEVIKLGFDSLRGIFDGISNGIVVTDAQSKILYVNPGYTRITGYTREDAIGENPGILHSGMQDKAFFENMWKSISDTGRWAGEIWNRHKMGHLIPEFLTITALKSEQQVFYIGVFSDISVLVEKNKKKLDLALIDPLTRLHNRSFLEESFKYIINQENKSQQSEVALLFIDVSKFKQINDTYGHLVGDRVLRYIADAIRHSIDKKDIAIRYGGDEFIIILNNETSRDSINKICEAIDKELKKPLEYEGKTYLAKINIGAAIYPSDAKSMEELIQKADQAMYHAKQNQELFCFFKDL